MALSILAQEFTFDLDNHHYGETGEVTCERVVQWPSLFSPSVTQLPVVAPQVPAVLVAAEVSNQLLRTDEETWLVAW